MPNKESIMIFILIIVTINAVQWHSATIELNTNPNINFTSRTNYLKESPSYTSKTGIENDNKNIFYRRTIDNSNHNSSTGIYHRDNFTKTVQHKSTIIKNKTSIMRRGNKRIDTKENTRLRFLKVFEVVKFNHVQCISTSGLEGRCLHEYDCVSAGGSLMDTCADGYGTCCVIQFSCNGQSSASITWFTNPEFPSMSTTRLSCTLTVNKMSQSIEQIRLDFTNFELLPPTAGSCEQDQFVISGQNNNNIIPILCGVNTGQHLYIEVGHTDGPIHLTIQTITAERRLFSIKVTQLSKSDILIAPNGCLQYFPDPHGYIESFNYKNISYVVNSNHPSYLNNLNYAICVKREKSSCSITYTNEDHLQIVNYDTEGLPIIPPRQAGVEIFNCPSDWLLISAVRLCGERLNDGSVIQDFYSNAPITDIAAGPITIWFRSDEGYVGRGFKLRYEQNSCIISSNH